MSTTTIIFLAVGVALGIFAIIAGSTKGKTDNKISDLLNKIWKVIKKDKMWKDDNKG